MLAQRSPSICSICPPCWKRCSRLNDRIADFSKIFTYAHNFIYLGHGYNYPTALEGALKLKEISYIHAEGYPAAEMKHGPIALIDAEIPTIAIATPDHTYEKTASNIEEIKARGGKGYHRDRQGRRAGTQETRLLYRGAVVAECLMPIVVSVPLQLLAYHIAVNKGARRGPAPQPGQVGNGGVMTRPIQQESAATFGLRLILYY